jgi:hypothetical protein
MQDSLRWRPVTVDVSTKLVVPRGPPDRVRCLWVGGPQLHGPAEHVKHNRRQRTIVVDGVLRVFLPWLEAGLQRVK